MPIGPDAYSHPQPHACFIQSVDDDLVGEGGIMDLWTREARLFKYGSGTGTNFSNIRGADEPLSGGGRSSGLMSFLKIGDRAAGAIKSGGTTRRAAKMVCLDADHPDIEAFVNWKVREEIKVAALVEGLKCLGDEHKALAEKLGLTLDYDFNGEAYYTVSGQNSNNSIRLSNEFFQAVEAGGDWTLTNRTDGSVAKSIPAKNSGIKSASPLGDVPTLVCNTTAPSMNGTPVRLKDGSTLRTHVRSTCSLTTPRAILRPSTS